MHPEIEAMGACQAALELLDLDARNRCLQWLLKCLADEYEKKARDLELKIAEKEAEAKEGDDE